jgi:hypothetical protein
MLTTFIQKFLSPANRQNAAWSPVRRNYLSDSELEERIYDKGYEVAGRLEPSTLEKLKELYAALHHFERPNGGMFYSVYSRDVVYRTKVHEGIDKILKPVYDSFFHDYRTVLNSFIVKVSGPESEFCLHQDSTGIEETKYSNLSVWIPLQDTDMDNGCLCVVPHSHKMFSPYRGISFPQPFEAISGTVRKYLQPIPMAAGDILLFDNRIVHNSVANNSGSDRIVIMSGIYPSEAAIISCFKDENDKSDNIEIIEQADDYLITYQNFLHDCRCRPETGQSAGFVRWKNQQVQEEGFVAMCRKYGVQETNIPQLLQEAPVQTGLDDAGSAFNY